MSNTNVRRIDNCIGCTQAGSDVRQKPCWVCTRTDSVPTHEENGILTTVEKFDYYLTYDFPALMKNLKKSLARQQKSWKKGG